jgi:hypothetical protein
VRIFVSCTTDDLGMFRDALCDRPAEWWGTASGLPEFSSMHDAKAESISPVDWSIRQASRADAVVLLLGRHHGSLAETPDPRHCGMADSRLQAVAKGIVGWREVREPRRFSYTQWEVLAAMAARVPILVFSPDHRSSDKDLQACRENTEADWLQDRQSRFSQWLRSRVSEDYFANRLDLVNKVRRAILRRQRTRRLFRAAMAIGGALVVVGIGGAAAHEWRVSAERSRVETQQARRVQEESLRHKYAVALGGAMAMLGRSSAGAARPVFEKALISLGLPQSQVADLSEEYNRLDGAAVDDRLDPAGFLAGKARLEEKALVRLNVIQPALAAYIAFGQSATELLLLLRFWDSPSDRNALVPAARDSLLRFQDICGRVEIPEELKRRAGSVRASDLGAQEQRAALAKLLVQCLALYEMEPSALGQPKETE